MMNLLKLASRPRKAPSAVLGLSWEGRRIEGTLLRRTPEGLQKLAGFEAELSQDIDSGEPETLGKELRSQLDSAGIRERQCVVAVPVSSLWVTQTEIPEMADADAQSLLQLEAEKGFHSDVSDLQVASSGCVRGDGTRWVTLAALSQCRLASLERLLGAARLKPLGICADLCELEPPVPVPGTAAAAGTPGSSAGVISLKLGVDPGPVALQAAAGGGVVALRSFEGFAEDASGAAALQPDSVAREIRITLAQLPDPWSGSLKEVRIHGPLTQAETLAGALSARLAVAGFRVHPVSVSVDGLPAQPVPRVSAVIAARVLASRPATLEFLPPRPSVLEQFLTRHAQGPRRTVWTVAGAVASVVALAFLVQQVQLSLLESRWSGLSGKVRELERIQQDLRQYRPWTPEAARGLAILEALSSAFPENGSVTAKVVEIRESGEVACSGTATDSPSFLAMTARLSALPGVSKVHHDQSRGASPMQFNLTFVWNGGTAR